MLHVTHTHLFPGARLTAAEGWFPADPGPVCIVLSDGAEADAADMAIDADNDSDDHDIDNDVEAGQ